MISFIIKRLFSTVVTIFVIVTITFFLMRLMPGGPFSGEKKLSPQVIASLNEKYGLDKPVFEQYTTYLVNLSQGDLGPSMLYKGRSVNAIIAYSLPVSARLGVCSMVFALIVGVYMGIVAALNQGKWQDKLCMFISTLGITVPSFIIATLLIYVFAINSHIFNAIGLKSAKDYVLPSIALGAGSMAFIARLGRSALLDVIRQDYIKVARAKGLSKNTVIYKHALRNSLIPIVTYIGPLIAAVLTGSFVIEGLFGIPGVGREFIQSIGNRDYTVTIGFVVLQATFLVLANLIVDILYAAIDPRIKVES
ncbi:ABC transporter permease [Clostridium sp.]|uniref:ABC transporter permease n=1 Tax=Clostridium sp. TaxID=1506 RepID=UPI001A4C42B5|nr:ABC transporter permease [Clostridium sp.]MBK5235217.1 ABC transporter permease [Clostridium sp.]